MTEDRDLAGIDAPTLRALLEWQAEMGADEAVAAAPLNRFALPERMPDPLATPPKAAPAAAPAAGADLLGEVTDPVEAARAAARAATDLDALRAALAAYPHCELRLGARNVVFSDGDPRARVMLIGEAPGRDEDIQGLPFVGRSGKLLDRILAHVGLARRHEDPARSLYITNVLPWRPPQNRDPEPKEVAMMLPFLERHVELVDPEMLILMGNHACNAVIGRRGITKLRGRWTQGFGRPAIPMLHTAYLLRNPHAKREAWADMLELAARLDG
jgi:DNA polymerase